MRRTIEEARSRLARASMPLRTRLKAMALRLGTPIGVPYIGAFIPNLGDLALYQAIKGVFEGVALVPIESDLALNTASVAIKAGARYCHYCIGGGTLINSPHPLARADELQRMGLRGFTFGTGVRDPDFWDRVGGFPRDMPRWAEHLRRFAEVSVRGPLSEEILTRYGVEHVTVIGDPALQFWRANARQGPREKRVGVNVGTSMGRVWGNDENAVLQRMFECSQRLLRAGCSVTVLTVAKEDHRMGVEFAKSLNAPGRVTHEKNHDNVEQWLRAMDSLDVVISYKLHAAVLAMCRSVPVVSVEYQPKCVDFMRSMQLERFNTRADKVEAVPLMRLALDALEQSLAVRDHIDRVARGYVSMQRQFAMRTMSRVAHSWTPREVRARTRTM